MSHDVAAMPLWRASMLLEKRELSPVDLVEASLRQIERFQPRVNAFITVVADKALERARELEAELVEGKRRGPLHGIPVALKDLFYTKGLRTTAGSLILADFVPDHDSAVAEKLNAAGAILIGKTNTHEFAFGPTTESSYFGPTRNPWNTTRISGGSSGGSGAAVAAGMAYMAMGTDTGGSIRIPASLCGVVGFKPSYGTVSLFGTIPLSFSLDHAGPLARSVMDIALTLDVISGYDERDPFSARTAVGSFAEVLRLEEDGALAGITVGIPTGYFYEKLDPEVEALVRNGIGRLADAGALLEELKIPGVQEVPRVTSTIMFAEAACYHRQYLATRARDYQADVRWRLERGSKIGVCDYIEAVREARRLARAYEKVLETVDVVVVPTVPVPAYELGKTTIAVGGTEEPGRELLVRNTRLGNLTGAPALSLPCGLTAEGLPAGLQIMGRFGDDATVLRVGHAFEKRSSWRPFCLDNVP